MWETLPKNEDWLKHAFALACSCCPSPSVHTYNVHTNPPTHPVHRICPCLIENTWLWLLSAPWGCQQHEQATPLFLLSQLNILTLVNWWKDYWLCWLRLQPGQQKTFSTPTSIPLQHMNLVNLLWVHRSLWPPPSFPSSKLPPSSGPIPHLVSAFPPLPPTLIIVSCIDMLGNLTAVTMLTNSRDELGQSEVQHGGPEIWLITFLICSKYDNANICRIF